jgi:tetratricopeptide (TPR) repeat protein
MDFSASVSGPIAPQAIGPTENAQMIQLRHAPLAAAISAVFLAALAMPGAASAQQMGAQQEVKTGNAGMSMHDRREAARNKGKDKDTQKAVAEALYPQATREEPEATPSRGGVKKLQKLQDLYQKQDNDGAIALANEIAGDASSNPYEKSYAYLIAGTAASDKDDQAGAADYFAKAVAANGLPNNDHYTAMFNLAVIQYGLDKYQDALATLDRFLSETKSDKPEASNLKGGILMGLERYDDAAALYTSLLAAKPDDKTLRMNAVAAYQAGDKPEKAMALLADAQAKGLLTTKDEYRSLYVGLINDDKDKDAVKVIEDGVAKGIIPSSVELSKDYMVLGQKAYYNEDSATAIEMYKRAIPMAADGEAALNLAKLYAEAGKGADAKAAAQQAPDKGVKDTAAAKKLAGAK